MFYKCELLVGGYVYSITEHIKNWDEITVSFKRNDYDGVVRSFTDKFEFVKGARSLLLNEYKTNYLKAKANIVIYTRNNSWTWTERFRCALNFSTLSDDGYVLSMNAIDDSVASLIKAKKGTQFEYSVDELKDSSQLAYDRLDMKNNIVMIYPPNVEGEESVSMIMEQNGVYVVPMYIETSEIVRKNDVDLSDQMGEFYDANGWMNDAEPYFIKNTSKGNIAFNFKTKFRAFYNNLDTDNPERRDVLFLRGWYKGKDPIVFYSFTFPTPAWSFNIDIDVDVTLPPGYILQMFCFSYTGKAAVKITDVFSKPTMRWISKGGNVNLDVIKPQTVLNRLLKSMNGGKDGLNGVIVPSGEKRLDNAMLLAAESARKMSNAKIYSSFEKFSKWMSSVFGYVYDINDKTVTFRPRKDYFKNEVVKTIEDYASYTMNVNSSLIYSQVNVGYDKQDYDSVNGKDEFRFTNEYSTGITITENKLELISPYRADAYGIEFLTQQIGEDTTDNSSDTDVFFVCVQSDGDRYILDRTDSISGVISPLTMFNVMYSPTSMITANEAFLGGFITELSYASSEGNTAVTINGKAENRDITLGGGLFNVNEVEIETSDIEIPSEMTGVIKFEHQGEIVEGYYKSTDFNYTKNKSAKITLIVKK